ncbi:hypothetical protein SORBI_3010G074960 [Sorghum bicolor]|uniref:Uncharacterized protein n=1 Tax=Sorghum bicolor TaxID=4558 RepID=A0A1W0VRU9_SORBI|nr:hypothetical protein SORBI_3010G074960 [Sorghum bicolor]
MACLDPPPAGEEIVLARKASSLEGPRQLPVRRALGDGPLREPSETRRRWPGRCGRAGVPCRSCTSGSRGSRRGRHGGSQVQSSTCKSLGVRRRAPAAPTNHGRSSAGWPLARNAESGPAVVSLRPGHAWSTGLLQACSGVGGHRLHIRAAAGAAVVGRPQKQGRSASTEDPMRRRSLKSRAPRSTSTPRGWAPTMRPRARLRPRTACSATRPSGADADFLGVAGSTCACRHPPSGRARGRCQLPGGGARRRSRTLRYYVTAFDAVDAAGGWRTRAPRG